ncbi:HAD family hydrolase [Microbacterium sp.]|uniref:HAD family hydrolase n=1 Tax=Microbacterium sp. TaxID=51671 RepID=UPI003F6F4E06
MASDETGRQDSVTTTVDESLGADAASTLFVSDLDFTLLGSDAFVSARTTQVINALVDRGLRFTYATARSHRSASRATSGLRLDLPVITYGGTMTVDPASGVPHDVRSMPADAIATILDSTRDEPDLQPLVHTFSGGRDAISWLEGSVSGGLSHFVDQRPGDPRLAPVASWSQVDLSAAYYVSIIGSRDEVAALAARLRDRLGGCLLILSEDPYAPGVHWLEIHSDLGSKASAARALADRLGMTRLVAFGDNHNDIPLFEVADEAYAVSNAVPELLRRATAVIGDNDSHAVAEWLATRFAL